MGKTAIVEPIVVKKRGHWPDSIPALQQLFEQATADGLSASVLLRPDGENATKAAIKRRHDIRSALRTLDLCVKALTSGYRFEDAQATAKIEAVSRAIQCLEREFSLLSALLEDE